MSAHRAASVGRCITCDRDNPYRGTRCPACARHWERYGRERPAWRWGQRVSVAAPVPETVDPDAVPDDDSPRARLARRMVHAALWQAAL